MPTNEYKDTKSRLDLFYSGTYTEATSLHCAATELNWSRSWKPVNSSNCMHQANLWHPLDNTYLNWSMYATIFFLWRYIIHNSLKHVNDIPCFGKWVFLLFWIWLSLFNDKLGMCPVLGSRFNSILAVSKTLLLCCQSSFSFFFWLVPLPFDCLQMFQKLLPCWKQSQGKFSPSFRNRTQNSL